MVELLVNGQPVTCGQTEITDLARKPKIVREPGIAIGDGAVAKLGDAMV